MVPWTQARARPGRSAPLVRFWPVLRIACVQTHRFLVFRNGPSFQARWAFACVRVGVRVPVRVRACGRVFSFPPSPPEPLPCGGRLSRPLLRVVLVEDAFEAASLQAEWGPGCLSAPSKPGGGGLGSHRYAGAAPGASSRPAPPVCASAAAVGAHGPAPSLGPCRACLVPFITTLTNPSRA